MPNNWKLTPSVLTFGMDCLACFYAEIKGEFKKPHAPFPSVFGRLDKAMREYWSDRCPSEIDELLPTGKVKTKELRVRSAPIAVPGHVDTCYISGILDAVLAFNSGGYGVLDFKTSEIKVPALAL